MDTILRRVALRLKVECLYLVPGHGTSQKVNMIN
jgi:hypothetical protein